MNDTTAIRHRIGIAGPPDAVAAALTTLDGLRSWWTSATTGDPTPGGKIAFDFGHPDDRTITEDRVIVMEVLAVVAGERVTWRCVDGPPEWIDSTITFALTHDRDADETAVLFTHDGWREVVPFLHHCSTKWAVFLLSLRDQVEHGAGRPFPRDIRLGAWD